MTTASSSQVSSPTPLRAVISSRLSSYRKGSRSTSPETQQLNGERKAQELGAVVVGVAADLDVSAFTVSPWNRPELGEWLRKSEEFDVLIVRAIDRLCRNLGDLVKIIEWALTNNIRIIFLKQDIDLTTAVGRLIAHILGAIAEFEPELTRERIQDSRERMRQTGRWPSGLPKFGYKTIPHESGTGFALGQDTDPVPTPEGDARSPSEVDKDVIARLMKGESQASIAVDYNSQGVPTPTGTWRLRQALENGEPLEEVDRGLWTGATIKDLVLGQDGEGYGIRGLVTRYTETRKLPGTKNLMAKDRPVPTAWEIELDEHGQPLYYTTEPLITEEDWQILKAKLDARSHGPIERVDNSPLVGIVKCGLCGHHMYRTARPRKDGSVRAHYQCMSRRLKNTGCPGSTVEETEAIEFVESRFRREVGELPLLVAIHTAGQDYTKQITEEQRRLDRIDREFESGTYDDSPILIERYRTRQLAIAERIQYLQAQPVKEARTEVHNTGFTFGDLFDTFAGEDTVWQALRRRKVTFKVTGKARDGIPLPERITYNSDEWDLIIPPSEFVEL